MKIVYIITKGLELYSDVGIFFSTLQKRKNVTSVELMNAFPGGSYVTAYLNQESAKIAVRQARRMSLVEDENPLNQIGFTYRSTKTPVILWVQLIDELEVKQNESKRVICRDMIDLNVNANVINIEEDYKGQMPATLNIKNINEIKSCTII